MAGVPSDVDDVFQIRYIKGDENHRSEIMNRPLFVTAVIAALVLETVFSTGPAMAQAAANNGDIFASVNGKATDIFNKVRSLLMVVGAFGVLGLAAGAFFGRFKWHWAVSLLGGLVLIAFVSQVLTYFGLNAPATSN